MSSSPISPTSAAGAPRRAVRLGLPDIALCGKAGAGKTTAAELLVELGYERHGFADALKDIAAKLWGEDARTDRDKLQKLGMAVRTIDHDTWVRLLLRDLSWSDAPVVVDDLRFENEFHELRAQGFVIVRVQAERHRRVTRLKSNGKLQDEAQLYHVSETSLDRLAPDYLIVNDGSKSDLYDELVEVMLRERRRR